MAHDTFLKSYHKFLQEQEYDVIEDEFIEEIVKKGKLARVGMEQNIGSSYGRSVSIILAHFYHYIVPGLYESIIKTESPIEKLFFLAMLVTATKNDTNVVRTAPRKTGFNYWDIVSPFGEGSQLLVIDNQANIGDHRVDFLLEFHTNVPDFSKEVKSIDGREIPGTIRAKTQLIVECDGHDFHEKTKEQAKKDKSRDRVLQSVGYTIFHFTGSEVYNDCFGCANQCYDFLYDQASSVS